MVGMPYYREQLLSAWPSHLIFEVGKPAPKLDPQTMPNMHFNGRYWQESNPTQKTTKRYQVEADKTAQHTKAPIMAPKFLSEKARDKAAEGRRMSDINDLAEHGLSVLSADVPLMYRNVEIKYSRFGVDDFDFE
jgi:PAB-dependent poly(A)-specific ribonuclease subunit 2